MAKDDDQLGKNIQLLRHKPRNKMGDNKTAEALDAYKKWYVMRVTYQSMTG